MTVRNIVQLSRAELMSKNGILRESIQPVKNFDDSLKECIQDLKDTLHYHKIAVGLAAPQIGIALQVAVINLKQEGDKDFVIINPKVLSKSGKKDKKKESCMSVPHYRGEVERREKINISYLDVFGIRKEEQFKGFKARVVAHEIDHLEGVLYTDHMEDVDTLEDVDFFR